MRAIENGVSLVHVADGGMSVIADPYGQILATIDTLDARYSTQVEARMLAVEITVKGLIDQDWCEWLGGLRLTYSEPDLTMLTGILADQSAVYGVISRLRDLAIPLASVRIETIETGNT